MFIPFARTALACAVLGSSLHAVAKTESVVLDDMVVSASGFEQKITEAPASISVISRDDLSKKPYSNLASALQEVEGIDVRQNTGKTGGLNISIRGMPSKYTLILIDGRRQNAPGAVTPNGFGDTSTSFLPPLSAIERIEVVRGPMSTLYGSDAMGGVVNIITRKVGTEWAGSISAEHTFQENSDFGEASKTNLYATGPLIKDLLGLQVRGSYYDRNESDLSFEDNSTVSRRGAAPVEGDIYNIGARLTLTPNQDHDLSLDIERGVQSFNNDECQLGNLDGWGSGSDTIGCSADEPLQANGYQDELRFEREQFALSHTGRYAFGTWDTSITRNITETFGRTIPGGGRLRANGTPNPAFRPIGTAYAGFPSIIVGDDRELKHTSTVLDTKLSSPLGDSHILTVGAQWWDQEMVDSLAGEDFEQTSKSLFLEDEWRISDTLALTVGARYDDFDSFGGHLSPRAYLVWNTTDNWTLKGGVSRGYKAPDADELHPGINGVGGQGASVSVGNPDLKPEQSTSTEIGAYYDSFEGFSANATLFHTKFEDKLGSGDPVPNPLCAGNQATSSAPAGTCTPSINIGEAQTQGLELAARWQFAPAWTLSGNYTYTDTHQKSNEGNNRGAPLTNTPQHMAHASLNWNATDRLSLYFKGEYRGERARYDKRSANFTADERAVYQALGDLKAYEVFHLGGTYKATDGLTLNAAVYNLFDKDFLTGDVYTNAAGQRVWASEYVRIERASATGTLEEGRRLWLSATYEF